MKIGFYPIVSRASWVERLLSYGVCTIQIRIKDLEGKDLEKEIVESIRYAKKYNAQLFVNDYYDIAIKHQAFGVHLGQEDILEADIMQIKNKGLHIGISTHSEEEVEIALKLDPSYIAIGPIFPTTAKKMKFAPQGIKGFKYWRAKLTYPLVAIGGMTIENSSELFDVKTDGIAVISDVVQNQNPEKRTKEWLALFEGCE